MCCIFLSCAQMAKISTYYCTLHIDHHQAYQGFDAIHNSAEAAIKELKELIKKGEEAKAISPGTMKLDEKKKTIFYDPFPTLMKGHVHRFMFPVQLTKKQWTSVQRTLQQSTMNCFYSYSDVVFDVLIVAAQLRATELGLDKIRF
jgi:hypothetical protein